MTNLDGSVALRALSDPTRWTVFDHLARGPSSVGEIARGLPVTRPAVSQHLRVLKEVGLVIDRPDGNRRIYSISPQGVQTLRQHLDRLWDVVLDSYVIAAEQTKEQP